MVAVGLARESSDAAEKEMAYEYQVERLEEYGCKWVFGDRISGTKDKRKGLDQALEKITSGQADELVVTHLFRLARSVLTIGRVLEILKKHNANLTILGGAINTSTPEGRAYLMSQSVWGQLEAELGAERQKIGWQNSRNKARPRAPVFGYLIKEGRFTPDLSNWKVARSVIDKYFDLCSLHGTTTWIGQEYEHLKSNLRQQRPPFTARGLRQWLLNPVLIGHVYFLGGTVRYLNQHEPLMLVDEQNQIRAIIQSKISGIERTGERRYAYSGLVYCGVCGSRCAKISIPINKAPRQSDISSEPNYLYYRCSKARYQQCSNTARVRASVIDIAVLDAIAHHAESIAHYLAKPRVSLPTKINPEVLKIQQQIDQLTPLVEIDSTIRELIAKKEQEIQNLLTEKNIPSTEQLREGLEILVALTERKLWDKYSGKEKGDMLRTLIKRVVVSGYLVNVVEFLPWISVPE